MPLLEGLSVTGLLVAICLPWLIGALGVQRLAGRHLGPAGVIGYGFFLGQLLIVALLLAWNETGATLAFTPLAWSMTALAVGIGGLVYRQRHREPAGSWRARMPDWRWPTWLCCLILLALILFRFAVMAQELALRPVFAWDAWMNWVPRAIVWFEHQELTDFVLPPEWLSANAGEEVYSLGNWRASEYPPGVPLILLWSMLGAGTSDHTLLYLPWLFAPAAFALALWSHLYHRGGPALSLLAAYLFMSQPLSNTHSMLVGYADLWLALYFSLGIIVADHVHRHRRNCGLSLPLIGLLLAAGCMLMKTPGLIFGAVVAMTIFAVALRLPARSWGRLSLIGLVAIALLLAAGMLPGILGDGDWTLPLPSILPDLKIQPRPLLPILLNSLFISTNWHLLWGFLLLAGLAALRTRGRSTLDRPALAGLVAAGGLLVFVFGFTHYFRQAENLVTLNRTLLYLVPLAVYLIGTWLATALRPDHADE